MCIRDRNGSKVECLYFFRYLLPKTDRTTMIAFADLYPTLLSIMGFQQQIPEEVQTFDLASVLLYGKENNRIVQPYYYIQSSNPATGYRGLRTATHTFTIHTTDGKVDKIILFDRRSDPYQMNNIAMQHPKLVNLSLIHICLSHPAR